LSARAEWDKDGRVERTPVLVLVLVLVLVADAAIGLGAVPAMKLSGLPSMPKRQASAVDRVVGRNIRVHRISRGLTQTQLAGKLGLAFQQLQKYEKGTNRVGSGRLFQIGTILGVPLMSFFEGAGAAPPRKGVSPFDMLADPLSLRLLTAFAKIPDSRIRRSVVGLVETMLRTSKA
jgi:transcriptional regulator with XRE-family HTH domain